MQISRGFLGVRGVATTGSVSDDSRLDRWRERAAQNESVSRDLNERNNALAEPRELSPVRA